MKLVVLSCVLAISIGLIQSYDQVFSGIEDGRVLPLLINLYGKPGRMNVPPADGRFLYDLVVQKGYTRGLEIGTSNGYSTLWLGLAFRKNGGKLITIEIDPQPAAEARENFRKAGLTDVIDLRVNDAFKEIPALDGPFDFVFLDAWKEDYKRFLDLVYPMVPDGGAIAAHNAISAERLMRDFLSAIHAKPSLETTIHKTSSAGVSVSFKRE